jgi:dTDP-4-dehydrorhamnose 3,5-epimerase|tara:strand:+ start:379 stop:939 length:561 start_codon:yes stop_codon:yes gene_type:complete
VKFSKTNIQGIIIIEPDVFSDKRGYFLESFKKNEFERIIGKVSFVQDNESRSSKGVLRGLHYQKPPFAQAKLIRCIEGEILDIAVDIRKDSPTYGLYHPEVLSGENKKQLFIPTGFAHGFVVLSDYAIFSYKVDNIYAPDFDAGVIWNDKDLDIEWKAKESDIFVSDKDQQLPLFSDITSPFKFLL